MPATIDRLNTALEGRYAIERQIGEGGMSVVYLATDVRHQRQVAIKVLRPELAASIGPERFLQEIRVTANLQHPHILPLFDSGEVDGFVYYVMPYLEGESLRDRLTREGELPVAEAARILKNVADALSAAHAAGIVHRDVKPDNVMITGRHAMVTDFGVAKALSEATGLAEVTTTGIALGTPAYMAPEQAAAQEHIDHRVDLYAVGVLGYELLSGRTPFGGMSAQQVLLAQVTQQPQPLTERRASVPEGLSAVLMRCLEKKASDRWQTAEELLQALDLYSTTTAGMTPAHIWPAGPHRNPRRWVGAAAGMGLIGMAAWWFLGGVVGGAWVELEDGFVIVPFENLTGDEAHAQFGSILADRLSWKVQRSGIAPTISPTATRTLAADTTFNDPIRHFAEGSGKRWVVQGSYYAQGDSLVVHVEIHDGSDGALETLMPPIVGPRGNPGQLLEESTDQILAVMALAAAAPGALVATQGVPSSYEVQRTAARAWNLFDQGENREGLQSAYRALDLDPEYAPALVGAIYGEAQFAGGRAKGDSLIDVLESHRDELADWDLLGLDLWQANRRGDWLASHELDRSGVAYDPTHVPSSRLAMWANRPHSAVAYGESGLAQAISDRLPWHLYWVDFAQSLHLIGAHARELEIVREVRIIHPDDVRPVRQEIHALLALGDVEAADSVVGFVESHADWDFALVSFETAQEARVHGLDDDAARVIDRGIRWAEERSQVRTNDYARGVLRYMSGDFAAALPIFSMVLDSFPGNAITLGYIGASLAKSGDKEGAREVMRELGALPHDAAARPQFARAGITAELGQSEEALRLLEGAYAEGLMHRPDRRSIPWFQSLWDIPRYQRLMAPKDEPVPPTPTPLPWAAIAQVLMFASGSGLLVSSLRR